MCEGKTTNVVGDRDLMYEEENLEETIRYCRARNRLLRDLELAEIEKKFWHGIEMTVGELVTDNLLKSQGRMEPIYNAWFVIDQASEEFQVPMDIWQRPASHMINFFVRMGRRPAITVA